MATDNPLRARHIDSVKQIITELAREAKRLPRVTDTTGIPTKWDIKHAEINAWLDELD